MTTLFQVCLRLNGHRGEDPVNLMHSDIHVSNVMLVESPHNSLPDVKLIDLGRCCIVPRNRPTDREPLGPGPGMDPDWFQYRDEFLTWPHRHRDYSDISLLVVHECAHRPYEHGDNFTIKGYEPSLKDGCICEARPGHDQRKHFHLNDIEFKEMVRSMKVHAADLRVDHIETLLQMAWRKRRMAEGTEPEFDYRILSADPRISDEEVMSRVASWKAKMGLK